MKMLIVNLITLAFLGWLTFQANNENQKKTRSLNKFSCRTPKAYLKLATIGGIIIGGFSTFGGMIAIMADNNYAWMILGLVIDIAFVYLALSSWLWKFDVNGNDIAYRSAVSFILYHFKFEQITRVTVTQNLIHVYADRKQIAAFGPNNLCTDNFLKRCEKENIPVELIYSEEQAAEEIRENEPSAERMKAGTIYSAIMNIIPIVAAIIMHFSIPGSGMVPAWLFMIFYPVAVYAGLFVFKDITRCAVLSYWIHYQNDKEVHARYWLRVFPVVGSLAYLFLNVFVLYYEVVDTGKYVVMLAILWLIFMLPLLKVFRKYARFVMWLVIGIIAAAFLCPEVTFINLMLPAQGDYNGKTTDAEVVSKDERYDTDEEDYTYYITIEIPDSTKTKRISIDEAEYLNTDIGDEKAITLYTSLFGIRLIRD